MMRQLINKNKCFYKLDFHVKFKKDWEDVNPSLMVVLFFCKKFIGLYKNLRQKSYVNQFIFKKIEI